MSRLIHVNQVTIKAENCKKYIKEFLDMVINSRKKVRVFDYYPYLLETIRNQMFNHNWPRYQCLCLNDFLAVLGMYQSLKVPSKEKIYFDVKIAGPELNDEELQKLSNKINTCFIDEINIQAGVITVPLDNFFKFVVKATPSVKWVISYDDEKQKLPFLQICQYYESYPNLKMLNCYIDKIESEERQKLFESSLKTMHASSF